MTGFVFNRSYGCLSFLIFILFAFYTPYSRGFEHPQYIYHCVFSSSSEDAVKM